MIILGIADIHGDISKIGEISHEISSADVVVLIGDLTHFGGQEDTRSVIDSIRQFNSQVLAVHGNCDPPAVADYLKEEGLSIHSRSIIRDGITFVGVGGSLPCPLTTPNELSEEDFERCLNEAVSSLQPGFPIVLVVHQPPFHTVADRANVGRHVGSRAIRSFIREHKPLLCLTGHIHEGAGMDTLEETTIVNPGPLWHGQYAYVKIVNCIDELEIREIHRE